MKPVSEAYETKLEFVRNAVNLALRQATTTPVSAPSELNVGVMWTFDDSVIIKDYGSGKLYDLVYTIDKAGIQFGEPVEVDADFVVVKLKALEATAEEISTILTAKKDQINASIELTGPFVMLKAAQRIAYAAVLVPGELDSDGEAVTAAKIEDVAHKWLEAYRNVDVDHSLNNVGIPVESYILPMPMSVKTAEGDLDLPLGTWILASKLDAETWKRVEKGELAGYSVMGVPRDAKIPAAKSIDGFILSLKKTLLRDLGDDWIAHTVSVVDRPAVPKSKWFCLKSARAGVLDKLKNLLPGTVEKEGRRFSVATLTSLRKAHEALAILIQDAEKESKAHELVNPLTPTMLKAAVISGVDAALKDSYPWDECMADQMDRYGDEDIARRVCGTIRARSQGLGGKSEIKALIPGVEKELGIKPKAKVKK